MLVRLRLALLVLPVVLLAVHPIDGADFWSHLATGRWIAAHHAVPHVDVFGQTAVPWVVHDWLAALLFFGLDRLGGAPALVLFTAGIVIAALALPLAGSRTTPAPRRFASEARWPYEVALLLTAGIAYERFFVRPEVFSLLGAAIWTQVLARGGPHRNRDLVALAAAQAAWTNLHGAFLLGPVLAALAVAGDAGERLLGRPSKRPPRNWRRLAFPFTSLASCTLTPYGPRLLAHVLQAAGDLSGGALRQGIVEWQPTFSQPVAGDLVLVLFVASLVWVALAALLCHRSIRGFDLLATLALVALACTARRQLAVYAVTVPPLAARWLVVEWTRRREEHGELSTPVSRARGLPRRLAAAASLVPACLALLWGASILRGDFYAWAGPPRSVGWGIASGTHPIGAGEFAARHALPGPLFNNIAAGSYLLWKTGGEPRVLVDGRLLDAGQFRTYRRALESPAAFDAWTLAHGARLVVLALQPFPPVQLVRHLAAAPDWQLAYFDAEGLVFIRTEDARARGLPPVQLETALPASSAPVGASGTWWRRCDAGEAGLRGRTLLELGAPAAGADLERAFSHCPEDRPLALDLAAARLAAGRIPEATALAERLLRRNEADFEAWLALGACRSAAGDPQGARRAWERARLLRRNDPRPGRFLADLAR